MQGGQHSPAAPPLWLLVLITISGTVSMHMFAPSLPQVATELHASIAQVQMTVTVYIFGLAVGQLIHGPLSDALGRRPVLIGGLALYVAAGVLAALAPDLDTLLGARALQALGGSCGIVLGRAIVRDTVRGDSAVRKLALMNLVLLLSPGLTPMLGGLLSAALSWRAIFWTLAVLGAVVIVSVVFLLRETGTPHGRFSARSLWNDYRTLVTTPRVTSFVLGGAWATCTMMAFVATAPFVFTRQLHRPLHEVGIYLGLLMLGIAVGNFLTSRLSRRISLDLLLMTGGTMVWLASIAMLVLVLSDRVSVAGLMTCMAVVTCGVGLTSPPSMVKSLTVPPALTGSASALTGSAQMGVGALCTLLSAFGDNLALSAALVMTVGSGFGLWMLRRALRIERAEEAQVEALARASALAHQSAPPSTESARDR